MSNWLVVSEPVWQFNDFLHMFRNAVFFFFSRTNCLLDSDSVWINPTWETWCESEQTSFAQSYEISYKHYEQLPYLTCMPSHHWSNLFTVTKVMENMLFCSLKQCANFILNTYIAQYDVHCFIHLYCCRFTIVKK